MPVDVARAFAIRAEIARGRDQQEVVTPGADALVDRHGRELFGTQAEVDLTPADARHVAPRHVLIEWVGQPSPYESETVIALKSRRMLDPIHLLILEQASIKRIARVDGLTTRAIGPSDGLSQTYRWGPRIGSYLIELPMPDAEKLLASAAGNEFRVREKGAHETRHDPDEAWKQVFAGLRKVSRARGLPMPPTDAEIAKVRVRTRPAEKLAGLAAASNAVGDWVPA